MGQSVPGAGMGRCCGTRQGPARPVPDHHLAPGPRLLAPCPRALLNGLSPCHLSIHQRPHTQLGRPLLPGWPRDHHCFSRGRPRTVVHGPRMWCPQASALGGRLADVLRTSHSRHGAGRQPAQRRVAGGRDPSAVPWDSWASARKRRGSQPPGRGWASVRGPGHQPSGTLLGTKGFPRGGGGAQDSHRHTMWLRSDSDLRS